LAASRLAASRFPGSRLPAGRLPGSSLAPSRSLRGICGAEKLQEGVAGGSRTQRRMTCRGDRAIRWQGRDGGWQNRFSCHTDFTAALLSKVQATPEYAASRSFRSRSRQNLPGLSCPVGCSALAKNGPSQGMSFIFRLACRVLKVGLF
jgi:hypothetical protein